MLFSPVQYVHSAWLFLASKLEEIILDDRYHVLSYCETARVYELGAKEPRGQRFHLGTVKVTLPTAWELTASLCNTYLDGASLSLSLPLYPPSPSPSPHLSPFRPLHPSLCTHVSSKIDFNMSVRPLLAYSTIASSGLRIFSSSRLG